MSEPGSQARSTTAGIVQDPASQQRVIPESRRADGSIRKERKVRPGFTPVEDVARFRPSRVREAEQLRQRGIPGSTSNVPPSASDFPALSSSASSPRRSTSGSAHSAPPGKAPSSTSSRQTKLDTPTSGLPASTALSTGKDTKKLTRSSAVDSSAKKPWPASKLRKPTLETSSAQMHVSVDGGEQSKESTTKDVTPKSNIIESSSATAIKKDAADDLAEGLDSLRLDKGMARRADDRSVHLNNSPEPVRRG